MQVTKIKKIANQESVEKALRPSPNLRFSFNIFNVFMLILKSKPISTTSELIKINVIKTIIVPIEPYNTLKRPKLFMNVEKPIVDKILRKVAITAPGDISFHRLVVAGAYL